MTRIPRPRKTKERLSYSPTPTEQRNALNAVFELVIAKTEGDRTYDRRSRKRIGQLFSAPFVSRERAQQEQEIIGRVALLMDAHAFVSRQLVEQLEVKGVPLDESRRLVEKMLEDEIAHRPSGA